MAERVCAKITVTKLATNKNRYQDVFSRLRFIGNSRQSATMVTQAAYSPIWLEETSGKTPCNHTPRPGTPCSPKMPFLLSASFGSQTQPNQTFSNMTP